MEVDAEHRTSVPGCYAAGDAMTKTHQVIVASASGVRAAIAINGDLTRADVKLVLAPS
jgi:thioredoxin reductase